MPQVRKAFVITNPMIAANRSAEVTLSKFLRVIKPFFENVTVIGGNLSVEPDLSELELVSFEIVRSGNKAKRAIDILGVQFQMQSAVKQLVSKNDTVFFWIGDKMILPYRATKSKGAEINYFIMGNVAKEGNVSRFTQLSSKLIRYMAEHADHVCMESKSVIEEWPGLKAESIRVIHLYTDNIEMNPISERDNVIGMVCRLTAGKHVLESIQAMAQVHRTHPGWKLEIIGSGRQQEECEKLITELHAGEYIKLLGWVEHDEIIEKSRKWKYLLFPTDTEGMPNGLLEMMGRGIPALTSPVGGIKDVLVDGINGFALTNRTTDSIRDGLIRIIDTDGESYKACAVEAFNIVNIEYSLDGAVKNAHDVIGA